jgi:hypothetical protein
MPMITDNHKFHCTVSGNKHPHLAVKLAGKFSYLPCKLGTNQFTGINTPLGASLQTFELARFQTVGIAVYICDWGNSVLLMLIGKDVDF